MARRGKPTGVYGKLTDDQLRALHRRHLNPGASIRELARAVGPRVGYSSETSAVEGIRTGWKRLGLKIRSQSMATAVTNRRRRTPGSPGSADRAAAKQFFRRLRGGYRHCMGKIISGPEQGRPCKRWALTGRQFCWNHRDQEAE